MDQSETIMAFHGQKSVIMKKRQIILIHFYPPSRYLLKGEMDYHWLTRIGMKYVEGRHPTAQLEDRNKLSSSSSLLG